MGSLIQLCRFWNPVLPVQVSDSVLNATGLSIGPLKNTSMFSFKYLPLFWYRCISNCKHDETHSGHSLCTQITA